MQLSNVEHLNPESGPVLCGVFFFMRFFFVLLLHRTITQYCAADPPAVEFGKREIVHGHPPWGTTECCAMY